MSNLINLERVSKSFGVRPLLSEVSLGIGVGERIGIVGRNGDGKTTLLRVLTGEEEPDDGRVSRERGLLVGYLRQTGLAFTEPQGAYYVMVDVSPLGFATDTEAAEWLVREVGVAGVPGSSVFREPETRYVRFHFAKKAETLHAAGEKLVQGVRGKSPAAL